MKSTTFNTQIIERRKTVTFGSNLVNLRGTFKTQIFIDFIPDELRVVNISYANSEDNEPGVFLLYSDIVSEYLGIFQDNQINSTNVYFLLQKPISGEYTFQTKNLQGGVILDLEGDIAIQLEFIKYKDQASEKIY